MEKLNVFLFFKVNGQNSTQLGNMERDKYTGEGVRFRTCSGVYKGMFILSSKEKILVLTTQLK